MPLSSLVLLFLFETDKDREKKRPKKVKSAAVACEFYQLIVIEFLLEIEGYLCLKKEMIKHVKYIFVSAKMLSTHKKANLKML